MIIGGTMTTFNVMLTSINDVKKFVNIASDQPFDIDIVSGRYIVDAKSIMGIFSIDLAKSIQIDVHGTDADRESFHAAVKAFVVD